MSMIRGEDVNLVTNLEIKRFVAVEDQDETTQLVAESFY